MYIGFTYGQFEKEKDLHWSQYTVIVGKSAKKKKFLGQPNFSKLVRLQQTNTDLKMVLDGKMGQAADVLICLLAGPLAGLCG